MRKMFSKMWKDDAGIVAFEYLLVATIIGLGLVVGLYAVATGLNAELTELANAILTLDQSYQVGTQSTCNAFKSGATFNDSQSNNAKNFSQTSNNVTVPIATGSSANVVVCP